MSKRPEPRAIETRRHYATEFRASTPEQPRISGLASVFGKPSQPLGWDGFIEYVEPGAFSKTIQENDVAALGNHDPNIVLGRNRANPATLFLAEEDAGLRYDVEIDTRNVQSMNWYWMIERGDVYQSSFGFEVIPGKEIWEQTPEGGWVRRIKEVRLWDVSPVTFPAYLDTEVEVDSFLRSLATQVDLPVADLAGASTAAELRSRIMGVRAEPVVEPPISTPLLDAARRRLALLDRSRH